MNSPTENSRQTLAAAQREVVRCLVGLSPDPGELDPRQAALAAQSLLSKRMRAVERSWPMLAKSLAGQFTDRFTAYAAHPLPPGASALADGAAFADFLHRADSLPDAGQIEWLRYRVRRRYIGVAWCREARRIAVALRVPWPVNRVWLLGIP